MDLSRFPGGDLMTAGLADLAAGEVTVGSLLVSIGAMRMRSAGLEISGSPIDDPELALYELLAQDDPDAAHSRYNALLRQLVSFERALECAA